MTLATILLPDCLFEVKPYEDFFYPMIKKWWEHYGDLPPPREMIPLESSFVVWIRNQPAVAVSVIMTNTPIAWAEFLIGNPDLKSEERRHGVDLICSYVEAFCRKNNKTRLFCMSSKKKTSRRYEQLGFRKTLSSVETFTKEIL